MNLIITAGGTREYIDPVRYITNASSGRMGYALAAAAIKAGHKVTLITAPTNLKPPKSTKIINVVTSTDMFKAVKANFSQCDCLIMAAAVSDYKPAKSSAIKLKKQQNTLILKLKPTQDILKWAGRNKKTGQIVIGFALEDKNILENAENKLKSKKIDMIIANSPSAISAKESTLHIKSKNSGWIEITAKKANSAQKIIKMVGNLPI